MHIHLESTQTTATVTTDRKQVVRKKYGQSILRYTVGGQAVRHDSDRGQANADSWQGCISAGDGLQRRIEFISDSLGKMQGRENITRQWHARTAERSRTSVAIDKGLLAFWPRFEVGGRIAHFFFSDALLMHGNNVEGPVVSLSIMA